MSAFYDVMVDIETTGVQPNRSAMIQLAAVRFNLAERTIDATDMFNSCLTIPNNRFWQESTREFWSKNMKVLNEIYERMADPATVMKEFSEWSRNGYDMAQPLRFWAKPTHFDYAFVQSYFDDYEIYNPYHFRTATDVNSFIRGMAGDSSLEQFKTPFTGGDAHNAIFDVINQIDNVFKAQDFYDAKP